MYMHLKQFDFFPGRPVESLGGVDSSLLTLLALVAKDDDDEAVGVCRLAPFGADLLPDGLGHLERLLVVHRVHDHHAVSHGKQVLGELKKKRTNQFLTTGKARLKSYCGEINILYSFIAAQILFLARNLLFG